MIKHENFHMLNLSHICAFFVVEYIKYFNKVWEVETCPKILPQWP